MKNLLKSKKTKIENKNFKVIQKNKLSKIKGGTDTTGSLIPPA